MEIGFLRDIVIVIMGLAVILAVISTGLISYMVFYRVNAILKSAKATAATVKALTNVYAGKAGKPQIQDTGLIDIIAFGVRAINKILNKGG